MGEPNQTDDDVRATFAQAMSRGWNTARMCAELDFWEGSYQYPRKPRDIALLRWTLDTIARIPGAQVLLVGNCTLKGPVPEIETRLWAELVASVVAGYGVEHDPYGKVSPTDRFLNVAIETHNEFSNCAGRGWGPHCPGKQDVAEHIRIYRAAGIRYVTADDSLCKGDFTLVFRLFNVGATPADFHPCREVNGQPWDPQRELGLGIGDMWLDAMDLTFLRRVIDANRGEVLFSETVAYADFSGQCDGLRTCDKVRVQSFFDRCAAVSQEAGRKCRPTFHSEAGLIGKDYTYFPEAR
jgi:hypothetical protein